MFRGLKNYSSIFNSRINQKCFVSTSQTSSTAPAVALKKTVRDDKFVPNTSYEGFVCKDAKYIYDFNMTAYLFEHERLKSRYLHIDRNDQNNVFGIGFRTTPFDSTGLPHILEHTTLCGSERYPVRDPFFKMLNRSVATFMNAMTGPDYTVYPFSSMNETDFRHLQMIYLDAVFKPNLKYLDFLQEGWRLENKDLSDPTSEYMIKGVVYNEMKGSYSEVSNYFMTKFLNKIFTDTTYQHCSGGDPKCIPNLTHQNLVDFHQKYYHPSNARFFSYGNFDAIQSLRFVNNEYLKRFQPVDDSFSIIPPQTRWSKGKIENIPCRYDNMGAPIEQQNQVAIGYLLSDIQNIYETFLLNVITELLVKGPNSKFYKNLIEPNISGGYSSITGFEPSIRDTMFVVGLQDVAANDFEKIQQIFDKTIDEVIEDGFDPEHIVSVLNNIELALKHQVPKFGLGILFNVLPIWMHGGDAIESLQYSNLINEIRDNLQKNPKYLQEKVRQYFKDNKHRLVLTATPDTSFDTKLTEAETKLIQEKTKSLSAQTKQRNFEDCNKLAAKQKEQENIDVLPCLSLADVEQPPAPYHLEHKQYLNVPTQICTIDTNNINYFAGQFNASSLSEQQKILLPLLANIIDQMGTKTVDYRTFDKHINLYTSGISFRPIFTQNVNDLSKYQIGFLMNSYCLEQNTQRMFDLITELIRQFNFDDVSRFEMLLKNYQSALSVGLINSGHLYAMQSAKGLVTDAQNLRTRMNGIEHIDFVKNLMEKSTPSDILQQLKEIAEVLFGQCNFRVALNVSEATKSQTVNEYTKFLQKTISETNVKAENKWLQSNSLQSSNVQKTMAIPVNYCAKAFLAIPYSHADFAPLRVLSKILSAKYLLPLVREQNGAYGAGATIDENGLFSFFSYRDPNTIKTLDTFDLSAKWINDNWNAINDQVLFEAKLGLLQRIDDPVGPGSKGLEYFKTGISQEMSSEHRRRVLSVNHEDLRRVNEMYLKNGDLPAGKFVLGPENSVLKDGWTINQS